MGRTLKSLRGLLRNGEGDLGFRGSAGLEGLALLLWGIDCRIPCGLFCFHAFEERIL